MKNDFFANIAASGIKDTKNGLIEPKPPVLEEIRLNYNDIGAAFSANKKMDTAEELYEEVEKKREYYRPFLKDYAPKFSDHRDRYMLKDFQWRIGTEEDARNLMGVLDGEGEWQNIKIPHYGEPRGVAVTYYRTEFTLKEEVLENRSAWIVFQGVDYKAHVFVNGCYLGSHEGFFAPFEMDFSKCAISGTNTLVVMVENDYIHMGNCSSYQGPMYTGDKFYAATGPGYDEPKEGWHHCPPGMGIYQNLWIEVRSRLFIHDIFVRPLVQKEQAELWLEIYSCDVEKKPFQIHYSVYGQNFKQTVFENECYIPTTSLQTGVGDTLTEAKVKAEGTYRSSIFMPAEKGLNYYKIPIKMKNARKWDLDTPWLYQCQVFLCDNEQNEYDGQKRQFGMRSFEMDTKSVPKGKFYLNGRQIRLRGANTMGHEQQCVMKEDWEQLLTDLLLAKVCNMNFLRLTQRPVQPQVYELCDRIGLMIQTDLPLFAALRRNQFVEGIKQVQEMEHLIRSHPCCIISSYINEPMPNAHNKPHRNLERCELEEFFKAADIGLKLLNPDRVIKHIDGDYEPPSEGYPDNHCYPCWYNGHGIDIGKLHKGYWLNVKEGWHYGCGEFGIEALEDISVMKKYYPKEWLPEEGKEYDWNPSAILGAQTGGFHYFFYDTQHSLKEWIQESQRHQADAISLMTQAYRRDNRMNSFAYHLFIDAFPDGWMKTIMDVHRNPKQGFFAYRDALTPFMVSLRTDRYKVYSGETVPIEVWVCNDRDEAIEHINLHYQILFQNKVIAAGKTPAKVLACESKFQGFLPLHAPKTAQREDVTIQVALLDEDKKVLHDCSLKIEIFPQKQYEETRVCVLGTMTEEVTNTMKDMNWKNISFEEVGTKDWFLVLGEDEYFRHEKMLLEKVGQGAGMLLHELGTGDYIVGNSEIKVRQCGMSPLHFASRATGHEIVEEMKKNDIRYWYDPSVDCITPLLCRTLESIDYKMVVSSGNQDENGNWHKVGALIEKQFGKGRIYINELKLFGRTGTNPTVALLLEGIVRHLKENSKN